MCCENLIGAGYGEKTSVKTDWVPRNSTCHGPTCASYCSATVVPTNWALLARIRLPSSGNVFMGGVSPKIAIVKDLHRPFWGGRMVPFCTVRSSAQLYVRKSTLGGQCVEI